MDVSTPRKRPRRHFSVQEKEHILNIFNTCMKEHPQMAKTDAVEFTSKASGAGISSIYKIMREYYTLHSFIPPKPYHRARAILDNVDDRTKEAIRHKVESLVSRNEPPTIQKVLINVNDDENLQNFKKSTLRKLLKEIRGEINVRSEPSTSTSAPSPSLSSTDPFKIEEASCSQLVDPIDTSELLPETSEEPVLNVATNPKLLYKGRNKDKIYCRLCLKPANKDSFKPLCDVDINYPGKSDAYKKKILEETKEIQKMLTFCIPFYNSMTFNPIICSTCLIRLKNSYQFATECLKNQQLIEKYADTYGTTERLVNINEMIETKFRNSDEANLSNIESEVCTSNIPPLPTNTTKKTNSKKYTHDSPIAKKRKTYHAPPEEDSLISSNDETSNIKVEPDEDDHSGLLIQGEPKREILDSDSLDSDSMIKIEPDYIDCPDFIKSEPEDNEHIENAAFNNRTGIGPDIQTNRAERHGSENVTLSRTNVSLSKRGSVFSNVDFSTEATTSDVIK